MTFSKHQPDQKSWVFDLFLQMVQLVMLRGRRTPRERGGVCLGMGVSRVQRGPQAAFCSVGPWVSVETLLPWPPGQVLGTPLMSTNVSAASSAGLCGEPLRVPCGHGRREPWRGHRRPWWRGSHPHLLLSCAQLETRPGCCQGVLPPQVKTLLPET